MLNYRPIPVHLIVTVRNHGTWLYFSICPCFCMMQALLPYSEGKGTKKLQNFIHDMILTCIFFFFFFFFRRCPLISTCNVSSTTFPTKPYLNRDMLELHFTSLEYHAGSAIKSASQLLHWLHLLRVPWTIGKTAKTVQKRMVSLTKEFSQLQKRINARADKGGNPKAATDFTIFLDAPFDKLTGKHVLHSFFL